MKLNCKEVLMNLKNIKLSLEKVKNITNLDKSNNFKSKYQKKKGRFTY